MTHCRFEDCVSSDSNWFHAVLEDVIFFKCQFQNATYQQSTFKMLVSELSEWQDICFITCQMQDVRLCLCMLNRLEWRNTKALSLDLTASYLEDSVISQVEWQEPVFIYSQIKKTTWKDSSIKSANLMYATIEQNQFEHTDLPNPCTDELNWLDNHVEGGKAIVHHKPASQSTK